MSVRPEDIAFAAELFAGLGTITHRKMMGGATLYADGAIFAILDQDGTIYLRSKGALAQTLRGEGGRGFEWTRPSDGKVTTMGYVSLPEAALDDPALACEWAAEALREGAE